MLASVLNSDHAIKMNIAIVDAFIALKQFVLEYQDLADQIVEIRQTVDNHGQQLNLIYEAIENMLDEKAEQKTGKREIQLDFGSEVEVFRDNLVYTNHIGHHNMMMQIEEQVVVIVEGRTSGLRVESGEAGCRFSVKLIKPKSGVSCLSFISLLSYSQRKAIVGAIGIVNLDQSVDGVYG